MAELFVCCGFFLIYFIEELVQTFAQTRGGDARRSSSLRRTFSLRESTNKNGQNMSMSKIGHKETHEVDSHNEIQTNADHISTFESGDTESGMSFQSDYSFYDKLCIYSYKYDYDL